MRIGRAGLLQQAQERTRRAVQPGHCADGIDVAGLLHQHRFQALSRAVATAHLQVHQCQVDGSGPVARVQGQRAFKAVARCSQIIQANLGGTGQVEGNRVARLLVFQLARGAQGGVEFAAPQVRQRQHKVGPCAACVHARGTLQFGKAACSVAALQLVQAQPHPCSGRVGLQRGRALQVRLRLGEVAGLHVGLARE